MSASHEEALRAADDENYDMKWDAACAWGFPCFAKEGAPSETTLPAAPSLPDPVLGAPRHPLPAWPSTLATGTSAEEEAERAAADHKWGAAAKNKYHLGAADDSVSRGLVTEAHFWRTLGASTKDVGAAPLGDTEAARNYIDKRCHVDGAMFIARGAMTATEALGAAAGVRLLGAASPRETLSSASVPPDADAVVSEAASLGPLEILVDVKARKAMKRGNAQPQAAYLCMELGQKAWLHSGRADVLATQVDAFTYALLDRRRLARYVRARVDHTSFVSDTDAALLRVRLRPSDNRIAQPITFVRMDEAWDAAGVGMVRDTAGAARDAANRARIPSFARGPRGAVASLNKVAARVVA